ncbi:PepSY domain-containing protein [Oceanobacillus sp. Castelsardo]|uniref:PepSY domain-containing protein n=1 Tax=Oceanobacillus sp. Castelsardo TaxID=1851204 RepID=UPI0008385736|nr:PepSY domain-containing protein [Oceanobacillus sp. Castelsardo]
MNKMLVTGIVTAGILLGGSTIVGAAMNDNNEVIVKDEAIKSEEVAQSKNVASAKDFLSVEKAKEIALSEQNGRIDSIDLEMDDDGYSYYEVEIENGDAEYDIYIEAYTGEVLHVEKDDHDDIDYKHNKALENIISIEEAKKIAVEKVGGKVFKIELDEDDNRYEYEIELKTNNGEVDMTIDAVTGKILEQELDD